MHVIYSVDTVGVSANIKLHADWTKKLKIINCYRFSREYGVNEKLGLSYKTTDKIQNFPKPHLTQGTVVVRLGLTFLTHVHN